MNNFTFITPEEMIKKHPEEKKNFLELKRIAKEEAGECMNCNEDEWKYGGVGLCFTCTTGEADASEDYELVEA